MKLYIRPNGHKYWYHEDKAPADAVEVVKTEEKKTEEKAKKPANKARKAATK